MSRSVLSQARVLIAADSAGNAALVKKLLETEFLNTQVATNPDRAVEDFEAVRPQVLVLAFDALEKAERYYLGLYRLGAQVHDHPHRTVILCTKEELNLVYQLCVKQHFDDYVLFWPMPHDALRLPMAVRRALADLARGKPEEPTAAEFAAEARRLKGLEDLLEAQLLRGGRGGEEASRAVASAEHGVASALEGFSARLTGALPEVVQVKDVEGLAREFDRLKREEIAPRFDGAHAAVRPLADWTADLRRECGPHLEAVRVLDAMARRVRDTILVADDDEFQRRIIARMLEDEPYHLEFADGGAAALNMLRRLRPELVLMDFMMPDLDGIEATRRLKAAGPFRDLPVVIMTGKAEKTVVMESLGAGAADFIVKPFDRGMLLAKITKVLGRREAALRPA